MRLHVAALALLAPSWAASADQTAAAPMDAFREHVADLSRTAADPSASPATVWTKGQAFFAVVPATPIRVEPGLRGWDFGREALGDGSEVTAKDLVAEGRERISDLRGSVPAPDALKDAVASAAALHEDGRLRVDPEDKMAPGLMGLYRYVKDRVDSGLVELSRRMTDIAAVIGRPFAYATVAHEADHRVGHEQGRLSPDRVIEGEVAAFKTQHDWLALVDPHGERLAYARAALRNQIRLGRGGSLAADSLKYLDHLAEVRATGGDRDELKRLVERLGYREGHGHQAQDGHDHAASDAPTRS